MLKLERVAARAALSALAAGVGVLGIYGCGAAGRGAAGGGERPGLVVAIAVDQLRADLLERYDTVFTGGFRRLHDEGMRYTRAMVDHAITVSHPGHASLATGETPARHGIVDAKFYESRDGRRVFTDALEDPAESIVGIPGPPGVSPRKFLATTLSEWAAAADQEARVVAVGSGRYASVLHAGRASGDVYWYMSEAGRYVTSTFYRKEDAAWVAAFNRDGLARFVEEAGVWENSAPEAARRLARPDDEPYESGNGFRTLPHAFAREFPPDQREHPRARGAWLASTPFLDAATLDLARQAVSALSLGRRGAVDALSIVLSQTDDIGHWYGPLSQEQLDALVRLDRALGEFFTFLDASVGRDRYVLGLSADHGAPNVPEYQRSIGAHARRVSAGEIDALLARVRAAAGASTSGEVAGTAARVAAIVESADFVADAMTSDELADPARGRGDPFVALYRKSFRRDRIARFPLFSFESGESPVAEAGVMARLAEGAMIDLDPVVHGSPYDYDRHVPMIFMGAGVRRGVSDEPVATVDFAPTLARLAGIPSPEPLDGHALLPSPEEGRRIAVFL